MLRAGGIARAEALLEGLGEAFGQVPVSVFQTLFAMVNPMQASLKLQKLARLDPEGTAARLFVALEDWLAEGVPMPAGAARDLLVGWQVRNLTATGGWRFLGGVVDPGAITAPGARRLGHARRDRAAAARRAARPGDPARPHAAPADRPRRHGGRQPGAPAGLAADRGVPRGPAGAGTRRHPVEPPRPMCEQGWPDAPAPIRRRIRRDDRSRIRGLGGGER